MSKIGWGLATVITSLVVVPANSRAASCDTNREKAERLEVAAATLLDTAKELEQVRAGAEDDASWGLAGEYLDAARNAVDAACGFGSLSSNPVVIAGCKGWDAGTRLGDLSVKAQRAHQGDAAATTDLACSTLPLPDGACEGVRAGADLTRGRGDPTENTLDMIDSTKEVMADIPDSESTRKPLGKLAGVTQGVTATIRINQNLATAEELKAESAARSEAIGKQITMIRNRAQSLRESATKVASEPCVVTADQLQDQDEPFRPSSPYDVTSPFGSNSPFGRSPFSPAENDVSEMGTRETYNAGLAYCRDPGFRQSIQALNESGARSAIKDMDGEDANLKQMAESALQTFDTYVKKCEQ